MRRVNGERLGRLARMLRVRGRLTQVGLSARAGVGRRAVSLLENGRARDLRLDAVERILVALGARLDIRVSWNGRSWTGSLTLATRPLALRSSDAFAVGKRVYGPR